MPQCELFPRQDLAASREVLPQAFQFFGIQSFPAPAHVLLELAKPCELRRGPVDRFERLRASRALVIAEKQGLHHRRDVLDRVQPYVIEFRAREKKETR